MRYNDSHVIGHVVNNPTNEVATSALVIETVCNFGGPKFVLSITPVAGLKADQQQQYIQEALYVTREKDGCPIVVVCNNCPLNQGALSLFGGPSHILYEGLHLFLIYDFPHILKNVRNKGTSLNRSDDT